MRAASAWLSVGMAGIGGAQGGCAKGRIINGVAAAAAAAAAASTIHTPSETRPVATGIGDSVTCC